MTLNIDEVLARGAEPEPNNRIIFTVRDLYGIAEGTQFPLNAQGDTFETGQMALTMDPQSDLSTNVGIVDYTELALRVRYGVQVVFPGLQELLMAGEHDLNLLRPIRATATDECKVTPDLSGWHAMGCLEVLPGSLWSGARGG